ncbi:MAG TPA: polysaccharide pyruvyl transferase family protein [Herpetosiphonaceae bacterium]|nr:polysaccharide pyruvyl transferase family protein [Herpetosiphonaceae bacterium]
MKALVAGWFSFENGHATAGDLLTRDLACEWLRKAGLAYDIAVAPPFDDGVDLRSVNPADYSHAVFVCGPFEQGELEAEFFERFGGCRLIGLNLSMRVPLEAWNPWDLLIERDSSANAHPDMAFLSQRPHVPVVGVCLVEEYKGAMVAEANAAIERLIGSREMAVVAVDTRLDSNATGLRTPAEIESLIARVDVMVTTRLHGTVLALKNGVPAVVIDPEAGGAKIRRQAETIGWPVVFNVDAVTDDVLQNALTYCLSNDGRVKARECRDRAISTLEVIRAQFVKVLTQPEELERAYDERIRALAEHRVAAGTGQTSRSRSRHGVRTARDRVKKLVRSTQGLLRRVPRRM